MSAYALPGLFPPLPFEFSNGTPCSTASTNTPHHFEHTYDMGKIDDTVPPAPTESVTRLLPSPATGIAIGVKDTKIDALVLIQSLTSSVYSNAPLSKKRGRRRMSPTSSSDDVGHTVVPLPVSPQELAMQLELNICHHGRHYTIIRSLHRIRQLRDELQDEWLDPYCVEASNDPSWPHHCTKTTIPELPTLPGHNGSLSNQSFASLHALLRSLAPAMERWLQHVVGRPDMVTRNATWTNFLLEPLCSLSTSSPNSSDSGSTARPSLTPSGSRPLGRKSSLESIEEHLEELWDEEEVGHGSEQ